MLNKRVSRRQLLHLSSLAGAGVILAACQPKIVEVEKIVRETVEVEKEVERVVEKEVERIVEKEVERIVTPTLRPRAADETIVLRYGTFWPMWRIDILNRGLAIFHQENPNIRVSVEIGGGVYRDRLATQFAANTEPDTGITDVFSMWRYYEAGLCMDLLPSVEARDIDIRAEYGLSGQEFLEGRLYGMPWVNSGHTLFYNKNMFREYEVPDPYDDLGGYWSWDQFMEAMRRIKQGSDGKVWPLWVSLSALAFHMADFVYGRCGRFYDYVNTRYTLNEPKTVEALEWLWEVYQEGLIIEVEAAREGQLAGMADLFSGQVVAMRKIGTGAIGSTLDAVGDAFEWDIVPCPTMNGLPDEPLALTTADSNFGSAKTQYRDEAAEFLMFLAGDDMQNILSLNKLLIPSLKRAARREDGFLKPPPNNIGLMLEPWEHGRALTFLFHHNTLAAHRVMEREMEYVILGQKTVREACDTMQKECNELIEYEAQFMPWNQWLIDFPNSYPACG